MDAGLTRNSEAILSKPPRAGLSEPIGDASGLGEGYSVERGEPSSSVSTGNIAVVRGQGISAKIGYLALVPTTNVLNAKAH